MRTHARHHPDVLMSACLKIVLSYKSVQSGRAKPEHKMAAHVALQSGR